MNRPLLALLTLSVGVFACERSPTEPQRLALTPRADASPFAAPGSSVSGSGTITYGTSVEHISVTTSGNSGRATFEDKAAGGNFNGQIDINCVNIVGNTATLSGIVTHNNTPSLIGQQATFTIIDSGDGSTAPDFASLINFYAVGTGPDCTVTQEFDTTPVKGNFTVSQ